MEPSSPRPNFLGELRINFRDFLGDLCSQSISKTASDGFVVIAGLGE